MLDGHMTTKLATELNRARIKYDGKTTSAVQAF